MIDSIGLFLHMMTTSVFPESRCPSTCSFGYIVGTPYDISTDLYRVSSRVSAEVRCASGLSAHWLDWFA